MDRESLFKQTKARKQNKNLSDEEIWKLVDQKLQEEELTNSFVGLDDEEKKKAKNLYDSYVEENSFESLAEKSTLANLVYLEILNDRIKTFIGKESKEKDGAIPLRMNEQLTFNTNLIMQLKEKLGMLKDKKDESALEALDELKEKALTYYSEHAGETYVKCPECQALFRLLMKIDNLDPAKATFFKGSTLYNEEVLKLYHEKKITLEEAAKIHGVHTNYIILIYEQIYLKEKHEKL